MTWSDDKAKLNHDVLANQVGNELLSLENYPSGEARRLKKFADLEPYFRKLLTETPETLSYAAIIDCPMFNIWDADFRMKIREIADALFQATSGVSEKVKTLERMLVECIDATRDFLEIPQDQRSAEQAAQIRHKIGRLRVGISSLPSLPWTENER